MKKILKIAKNELLTMFYSPVAWLILIVFAIQLSIAFVGLMKDLTSIQHTGGVMGILTNTVIANPNDGLLTIMQKYFYLYMPLLTMGLMSREYASGTIKLLYSSPITAKDIVLGKFLGMVTYGCTLLFIVLVLTVGFSITVENFNYAELFVGLLGMFLLLCAYSAIGLFVSSLTSYPVVAAIGTLVILAVLNYANQLWQDIDFVREITYWLCLSGRTGGMVNGLISSEDLIYFVVVIALFLLMSILKVQSTRRSERVIITVGRYASLIAAIVLIGYFTSRPEFKVYGDVTENERNTLSETSREIMSKLKGAVTITTYVNMLDETNRYFGLPKQRKGDEERFERYLRFNPKMQLKYVYYYADAGSERLARIYPGLSPKEQMEKECDREELNPKMFKPLEELDTRANLAAEGYKFVRTIECEDGQMSYLRLFNDMQKFPSETEISVAFKRFTTKLPIVGFLTGQGEPSIVGGGLSRDYTMFAQSKVFRQSLINQGFDVEEVSVSASNDIPNYIDILVIGDMNRTLTEDEQAKLDKYIARGGNLLIAGKARKEEVMNPLVAQFGVKFLPGTLVQPHQDEVANVVYNIATPQMQDLSYHMAPLGAPRNAFVAMTAASPMEYTEDKGYNVNVILRTDSVGCWSETETIDFINENAECNPAVGEVEKSYATGLSLTRSVNGKEQRILILSDATAISNDELSSRHRIYNVLNFPLITGGFHWFSYGETPINVDHSLPTDLRSSLTRDDMGMIKFLCFGLLPGLLFVFGVVLSIRRQRR